MSGSLIAIGTSTIGVGQQVLGMTGLGQQLIDASGGLLGAFIKAPRSIGTASTKGGAIIPDVTVEEQHSDRLTVTQHPIADGSPVHDHVFKLPATVVMRCGFTNANPVGSAISGGIAGFASGGIGGALTGAGEGLLSSFGEQRCKQIYQKLLTLQFDQTAWDQGTIPCKPFDLTTGKRPYKNMVITELSLRTDRTSEYSMVIEVHMQEVRIVKPSSTTQPSQENQTNPQKTASPGDQSTNQPNPSTQTSPNSILGDLWGVRPT